MNHSFELAEIAVVGERLLLTGVVRSGTVKPGMHVVVPLGALEVTLRVGSTEPHPDGATELLTLIVDGPEQGDAELMSAILFDGEIVEIR